MSEENEVKQPLALQPNMRQLALLPTIPHLAGDAFVAESSKTGITGVFSILGRPLALMIMSPGTAKSVAEALLSAVSDYERISGTTVKSSSEVG